MSKFSVAVILVVVAVAISGSNALFLSTCPNNTPMVNCFADPCGFAKCDAHPKAVCRSNYCGGCNAEFYLNGKKVDCLAKTKAPICNTVNCFVAPCRFAKCEKYPDAVCQDNYCGGCFANFYLNGTPVDCTSNQIENHF